VEDHRRAITAALLAGWLLAGLGAAAAQPLDQRIPDLFGGLLNTTIKNRVEGQPLQFSEQFRTLSAGLAAARSQAPIPSASGAFRFEWDNELDTFVRSLQSLGPGLAERAQTLGRHTATLGVSYTRVDFDTLEGQPLSALTFSQGALSKTLVDHLGSLDARFKDDLLRTQLNLGFNFDLLFLTAAYGITDAIDVSLALSINRAQMHATARTTIVNPDGSAGDVIFLTNFTNGMDKLAAPSGRLCEPGNLHCATDGFSATAVGTGDLFLRSKWHFADTEYADLAVAGVLTVPTGNADNFLGFHDPTFTPWLIASKTFDRVSPHLNLGYAFRSGADVSQAQWIAGADVRTFRWLTLAGDFLGYHDDKRDGVNDDVIQSAVGFKLNPFGQFVLAGTFQFPLNRDGLRADVIYTGQIEYTF
jgi:hypothetical protein